MESVTCCFLTGLNVLARISKEHGVSVEFQQEPAPASSSVILLRQLVSADSSCRADTSVQEMRVVKDLHKRAEKVLVERKMICSWIRVFVRDWKNYSLSTLIDCGTHYMILDKPFNLPKIAVPFVQREFCNCKAL